MQKSAQTPLSQHFRSDTYSRYSWCPARNPGRSLLLTLWWLFTVSTWKSLPKACGHCCWVSSEQHGTWCINTSVSSPVEGKLWRLLHTLPEDEPRAAAFPSLFRFPTLLSEFSVITSPIDWHSYAVSESGFLSAINSEQDLSGYILHCRQLGASIIPQGLYFSLEFLGNGFIGCLGFFLNLCLG